MKSISFVNGTKVYRYIQNKSTEKSLKCISEGIVHVLKGVDLPIPGPLGVAKRITKSVSFVNDTFSFTSRTKVLKKV